MAEKRQGQRCPMNEWGLEVSLFCVRQGMTKKELAAEAGVKYDTMMKVLRGKRAGHEARTAVQQVMDRREAEAKRGRGKRRGA